DLPRTFNDMSAAAVNDADHVLIVTEIAVAGMRNAAQIYDRYRRMGIHEERIEVVVNRYRAKYGLFGLDDVKAHFGKDIFGIVPNDYQHVKMALDMGKPVAGNKPNSPVRLALREMATKIAGDLVAIDRTLSNTGDDGRKSIGSQIDEDTSPIDPDSPSITKRFISAARKLTEWSGKHQNQSAEKGKYVEQQEQDKVARQRLSKFQEEQEDQEGSATQSAQLEDLQHQIGELSQESEDRAPQITQLTSDLEEVKRDRDAALQEQAGTYEALQAERERLHQLQNEFAEAQQQQENQREQIGQLHELCDHLQKQVIEVREELKGSIIRNAQLKDQLQQEHNLALEQAARSNHKLQEKETQLDDLQSQIGELSQESEDRAQQISDLEEVKRDRDAALQAERERLHRLQAQFNEVQLQQELQQEQIGELQELRDNLQSQITEVREELDGSVTRNAQLEDQLQQEHNQALEQAVRSSHQLQEKEAQQEQIGELQELRDNLQSQITEVRERLDHETQRCLDLQEKLDAQECQQQMKDDEILRISHQRNCAVEEVEQLKERLRQEEDKVRGYQGELDMLRGQQVEQTEGIIQLTSDFMDVKDKSAEVCRLLEKEMRRCGNPDAELQLDHETQQSLELQEEPDGSVTQNTQPEEQQQEERRRTSDPGHQPDQAKKEHRRAGVSLVAGRY
ncbi:MAG: AAA family ATPase, partial [Planctomycetota bacterium]